MTIVVECPHCESRFHLQPDLTGKAMRCPNPDCREVFTALALEEAAPAAPPPPEPEPPPPRPDAPPRADAPPPAFVSGTVGDLVPVLEAEAAGPGPAAAYRPYERVETDEDYSIPAVEGGPPPDVAARPAADVLDAEPAGPRMAKPVLARPARPDGPKEVVWSDVAPPPAAHQPVPEEDDEPIRRRRNRRAFPVGILMGILVVIFFIIGGIFIQIFRTEIKKEAALAEQASEAFKTANYQEAAKLYDQLLAEFPTSEDRPRYEFFSALSGLHVMVGTVTFAENPGPGLEKYRAFLATYGDDPLAQPDEAGHGLEVFEAGRKLADGLIAHARDRLGKYRADLKKLAELDAAEQTAIEGTKLLPVVEKYRVKDIAPLIEQPKQLAELTASFARERHRLEVLKPWRNLADDPTDPKIAEFVVVVKRNDLEKDREATEIVNTAKANLRKLIRTVVKEVPPVQAPADVAPALLFVAAPAGDKPNPTAPPAADVVPETFFAVAKGILYAFDVDTGNLLWAARVGTDPAVQDVPVRILLGDGGTELVLVPSNLGNKPGLTARVARTGEPYWHQPLEARCAARPVVVGKRAYVPLLDDFGTVVEIEAGTGMRMAHVTLRQRLGAGMLRQPGTGLVYVAAEGRRVFVLDVEPLDADGTREPMRCAEVLFTDHPDQSLKTPPVLAGPSGDAPAPRFLILAQAFDTRETRVRSLALPPVSKDRVPPAGPPEVVPTAAGTATLPGHVTFPPAADGERVAVVTDAGAFALYGTNQPGNQDPGLYPVPATALPTDPKQPAPGQVVYAEEGDYWVLARGELVRLRLGLTRASGLQVAPAGVPRRTGLPVHRPQVNARRDTVLAVVRSDESDGVRAVAMDPRDGRIKWQRKVGAVAPAPPVPQPDGSALLVDEDGGVYRLPTEAAGVADAGTRAISPDWVLAPPTLLAAGLPRVAATPDGQTVWVLIPERAGQVRRVRVRRIADGKLAAEAVVVALPDGFAGGAAVVGATVVVPLADGFVYRYEPGRNQLVKGPQWRGEGVSADAECFLSAAGGDEFIGSDGGRRVVRWRWPSAAGATWAAAAGPWEARARVAFAPTVFAAGATARRMLVADRAGNVWLFDADKAGEPLRRWRRTATGVIPAQGASAAAGVFGSAAFALTDAGSIPSGEPTGPFGVFAVGGRPRAVYGVGNRHVVCLDPGEAAPAWTAVGQPGQADLLGWSESGGRVVVTDQAGRVTAYAAKDGAVVGGSRPALADLFPQASAVAFAGEKLLLPLWDGSAVFLSAAGR